MTAISFMLFTFAARRAACKLAKKKFYIDGDGVFYICKHSLSVAKHFFAIFYVISQHNSQIYAQGSAFAVRF